MRRVLPAVGSLHCCALHLLRVAAVDRRSSNSRRETRILESGVRLEPGNADAWDALGRFRQLDLNYADPAESLAAYKRAVEANPHSATLHMNLAAAYEGAGDIAAARVQFAAAAVAYPFRPKSHGTTEAFFCAREKRTRATRRFAKRFFRIARFCRWPLPAFGERAATSTFCSTMFCRLTQTAYSAALDYFSSIHQTAASLVVWERLIGLGQPMPLSKSFPLIDALIQADDSADACPRLGGGA